MTSKLALNSAALVGAIVLFRYRPILLFRVSLAKLLIGDYCTGQRTVRPSTGRSFVAARPLAVLPPRHFPHHHPRRRCTFCQHHRKASCGRESVWHCTDWQGSPTLCLTGRDDGSDCWRLWYETMYSCIHIIILNNASLLQQLLDCNFLRRMALAITKYTYW